MTNNMLTNNPIFSFPLRVYYEDTDAGGVVYHANYLNFFERARTEWLRDLGYEQDDLKLDEKIIFIVRKVEINYLQPAIFNDLLMTTVEIIKIGASSIELSQQIIRNNEEKNILSTGKVLIVCINSDTFKPKKIPKRIRAVIGCT